MKLRSVITLSAALAVLGDASTFAQENIQDAVGTTQIVPGIPNSALAVRGRGPGAGLGKLRGHIVIPASGRRRLHTNYRIFVLDGGTGPKPTTSTSGGTAQLQSSGATQNPPNPPYAGYYFETPASLACIYGLVARASGCDPNIVKTNASGGVKAIGIVALQDDTSAMADLQTFSTQFGLPAPNLTIAYVGGKKPSADSSYAGETALDLDMVHALAPNAPIILVEGSQTGAADFGLSAVVDLAVQKVQAAGGGVVSASYGVSEFSTEANYESHFSNAANVVIFASSGDDPGVLWPSVSPNVIAVGGTGTAREMQITSSRGPTAVPTLGQFKEEVAWDQAGGGFSKYFPLPTYQNAIAARLYNRNARATPDVSAVADPATAVWMYCSTGCGNTASTGWLLTGGTSVASPLTASMTSNMGPLYPTTAAQLQYIYSQIGQSTYFDVARGICGPNAGFAVTTGTSSNPANQYDLCTGVGSPRYAPPTASSSVASTSTR